MSALYYRNDRSQEELLSKSPYFEVKVIKKTREAPEEHPKKCFLLKTDAKTGMAQGHFHEEWMKALDLAVILSYCIFFP